MGPEIFVPLIIFAIPIVAIITSHQRKLMEMKLKMGSGGDSKVAEELRALKQQMAELRDTTTRYDISFDAALQRIESRVGHIESKVATIEQAPEQARIER
jgi:hypothetical protein